MVMENGARLRIGIGFHKGSIGRVPTQVLVWAY